jgi:glycosyltransferase involved in cell wall biosynthesis
MRIAWLTPYLPLAENTGGRIRIARLARGFEADDELVLYSRIGPHDTPLDGSEAASGPWQLIRTAPSNPPSSSLSSRPSPARSMPRSLSRRMAEDDARAPFDAVVVEHCYAIESLPRLAHAAVIVDEHNIESDYYRRLLAKNPLKLLEYSTWRRYERSVWERADEVVTVSSRDADVVRAAQPGKGVVATNGTRVEAFRYIAPSARTGSAVLYVGMMDYPPNRAAALTLAREILPKLRQHVPDATLTLVGRNAGAEVRALASDHVQVTGAVPEVFPFFDQHAAYAMPLFQGAGSSLKVLEPFAAGLPLVASEFGVRGYGLDGSEYIRADDIAGFVSGLTRALTQRTELDALAERAKAVAARHAWSTIGRQFAEIVRSAVHARRAVKG